jgi:hypothetical protein
MAPGIHFLGSRHIVGVTDWVIRSLPVYGVLGNNRLSGRVVTLSEAGKLWIFLAIGHHKVAATAMIWV